MKMRYSLIPSRAVGDQRLSHAEFRTLSSMTLFTSALGICYPSQELLASIRNVSQGCIAIQMRALRRYGYIRDLVSIKKKHPLAYKVGNRYQIPTLEHDPIPTKEQLKEDVLAHTREPLMLNVGVYKGGRDWN